MMTRYRVTPVSDLKHEALMISGFAVAMTVLIVLVTGSWRGLLISMFLGFAGTLRFATRLLEIELPDGRTVVLRWFRRTRVIRADALRSVNSTRHVDEDGDAFWYLEIRHAWGRISVPYFAGAAAFVENLRRMDPGITVTGMWPTRPAS
jgi:hypothetical protein